MRLTICCALLLCAGAVLAQGRTDFTLNEGQVHFRVPADWNSIMEKSEGDPQAIAFQVPDASANGSEDSANATVKTRRLRTPADFAGFVQDERARAQSQTGYERDASNKDDSTHRYFVQRGQTRYFVVDRYHQSGDVAVELRCQRPLLERTPAAWNAQFDAACASVAASLK